MTAPAAPYESDALDPTLYVRGVAHDLFRWMRENDPVHRDERNGIWVVSKYEDVSYVERQPELFSSAKGVRPRDDLISVLLSSADAGEISFDEQALHTRVQAGGLGEVSLGLGADDLLAFLVLLLVAGNETTRNALSGGMLALSNFPAERAKLVRDLSLVNSATEEVLRYGSPVLSFSRIVTRGTEPRALRVAAGDIV